MKVVSGSVMQQLDRQAIDQWGVPGLTLMENAGRGCATLIHDRYGFGERRRAVVVAGKGNNGGDGFVIARYLREWGWEVTVFLLARRSEVGGDAAANLHRLDAGMVVECPGPGELAGLGATLREATVLIDALLGTGLANPVLGAYAEAIELLNDASRPVVAVDIPSGIDAGSGRVLGAAVRADLTVTFALAKLGQVLYPGAGYTGHVEVIAIGIPEPVLAAAPGCTFLDVRAVRPLLRRRERTAHKGSYGHCLILAGSPGKTGAAAMAANSAVRAGAGLVTLAVPELLNPILEVKTTEAMTLPLPDGGAGYLGEAAAAAVQESLAGKSAVAIGPGIGRQPATVRLVRRLVAEIGMPLVVDADGLNALAEELDVLLNRPAPTILTPHPGEMARLAGTPVASIEADRIAAAREFAARYRVHLVLKGARTIIATPDGEVAINGSGNPGMASGGMGDVLTGVLAALLAQGYDPFSACRLGVFLHGLAADLVAEEQGEIGIAATDVQERLPHAFRTLLEAEEI